ncbi:MAG: histidine kinase dimerization/phosphoacceptor domain-containing protein, partial [Myxococcota bacterium]
MNIGSPMHIDFDHQTRRWLDFAAYATWLALGILATILTFAGGGPPSVREWAGFAATVLTIGLGVLQLRRGWPDRRPLRDRPRLWVVTASALTAVWAFEEQTFAVFLIIVASTVAESGRRNRTLAWLLIANAGLLTVFVWQFRPLQVLISFPLFLGFQLFSVGMNNAVGRERELREELAGVNAELLATRRLLSESARSQERLRISRELHDVAGHRLTALKLNLRSELERSAPDTERLRLCFELSDELLGDIRSVVHQLRASDEIDVPTSFERTAYTIITNTECNTSALVTQSDPDPAGAAVFQGVGDRLLRRTNDR